MALKVFHSLTRKKEEFTPERPGIVTMYVCGPTVYALSHIGHARSAVAFDVIYRYLGYKGFKVTYARNYTDIDDKIINRAEEEGIPPLELAEKYIKAFDEDMDALGIELPTIRPRATLAIPKIIEVTKTLIDKGFAYESKGTVFYSVRKFKAYGKLSGKNIDELESGARVEVDETKEDPLDFALWKASKAGEPSWESPRRPGRPCRHIECSAMCMENLGDTIDIHGGGKDLIFPHHENEVAQSEAALGKAPFVRYWLHNGFVNIEKEKMSKSIGNILNIRDALNGHTGEAVRLFLLSSHYRSPIDYTRDSLKDAETSLERFYKTIERAHKEWPELASAKADNAASSARLQPIINAMDDDFNTAEAIGMIFREVTNLNRLMDDAGSSGAAHLKKEMPVALAIFKEAGGFLGCFTKNPADYLAERKKLAAIPADEVEQLINERNGARNNKDFKRADEIRMELSEKGVLLEDTAKGTVWRVKA